MRNLSHMSPANLARLVVLSFATLFFIAGIVFAYIGILNHDDVFGGLAGLNFGLAVLLGMGVGFSYM